MAMLAFNPTAVTRLGRLPAPAGVWRIEVKASPAATEVVHLYIARGQLNIGALRRSQQARFVDVDETYDPERPLRYGKQDPEPPRSAVRRNGSLSSLATGPTGAGITVVGGYFLRGGAPSNYSSGGPAAAGRFGPDLAAASDETHALTGIRSAGCRSAEVVRMVGTSFAAPQVARVLINQGKLPALTPPPAPVVPRRSGAGHLPPSPD